MMMRFLATADLHIKEPQDCRLLRRILQIAAEQRCEAILIGGDLLDTPFPGAETEQEVQAALAGAGMPVLLAAGNHDPLAVTPLYRNLPQGVFCFPEALTALSPAAGIRIFGCSSASEQADRRILAHFQAPEDSFNILLAHGRVDGSSDFQPISSEELAASRIQLAIIGHIHKGEQRQIGSCTLLVPGIPQGRGWDETGDKWVYIADVQPNGGVRLDAICAAEKVYREYRVDLSGCPDSGAALHRMEQLAIPDGTVARLILTGTPEESPEAAARIYTERYGREVKDQTDSSLSISLLRKQNTLQGAFVRKAMAEIERAPEEERPLLERALRLGLQALEEAKK